VVASLSDLKTLFWLAPPGVVTLLLPGRRASPRVVRRRCSRWAALVAFAVGSFLDLAASQ
jgi:hypothetical protein